MKKKEYSIEDIQTLFRYIIRKIDGGKKVKYDKYAHKYSKARIRPISELHPMNVWWVKAPDTADKLVKRYGLEKEIPGYETHDYLLPGFTQDELNTLGGRMRTFYMSLYQWDKLLTATVQERDVVLYRRQMVEAMNVLWKRKEVGP